MSETKIRSRWKQILVMALKIYAGLCTLLVTALLALLLWQVLQPAPRGEVTEEDLKALGFTGSDLKHELQRQSRLRTNSVTGLSSTNAPQPNGAADRSLPLVH